MEKGFEDKVLSKLEVLEIKVAVIDSKINDDLKVTKSKSDEAYIIALKNKEDIIEIKEKNKWLSRTVTASLIALLFDLLYTVFKVVIK